VLPLPETNSVDLFGSKRAFGGVPVIYAGLTYLVGRLPKSPIKSPLHFSSNTGRLTRPDSCWLRGMEDIRPPRVIAPDIGMRFYHNNHNMYRFRLQRPVLFSNEA
jgi:hypothetical protein